MTRTPGELRVVVAGASFPSLEPERQALRTIGGEVIDARGLDAAKALELCQDADGVLTDYFLCSAEVIGTEALPRNFASTALDSTTSTSRPLRARALS